MYLRYALFAPLQLAFNLFVIVTCWLWAGIAAVLKLERLPMPLGLVQTHDDDIYGSRTTKEPIPVTVLARWKRAMWWLCRNPGYGFAAYVLGFGPATAQWVVTPEFGDKKDMTHPWGRTLGLSDGRHHYFSYQRQLPWLSGRYVKIWLGWTQTDNGTGRHMIKIMFNPFLRA